MKLAKKIVLLLFAVILSGITMFSVADKANAIENTSYRYEVISKKDKTCKITMAVIADDEDEIVIPSKIDGYTVVELGKGSFKYEDIVSVTVPSTVTTIGNSCFASSEKLKTVKLSKGLKTIGDNAFAKTVIESITIPSTVTQIGSQAFIGCAKLKTITIPSSVKELGDEVFYSCSNLKTVTIPSTVTKVGTGLFRSAGVEKVDFLCSVTTLPFKTFERCESLKEVNLSSKITEIGTGAFSECDKLTAVKFSGAEKKVSECSFANSIPKGTIVIPGTVKVIGHSAFSDCPLIKKVFVGEGLTTVENYAFAWCDSLETVVFPSTLQTVGSDTFVYSEKVQIHSKKNAVYEDNHTYTKSVVKPTCAKGYTLNKCKCGLAFKNKYTAAVIASHTKVNITAVKATTKQAGRTSGSYCKVCNTVFKQSVALEQVKGLKLSSTSLVYNGKTRTPTVTVVDKNGKAIASSNYTVTLPKNSVNIGTYTVKVTLKGNYSGTLTQTYKIVPKGTYATKLSRIAGGFKIAWKQQTTKTDGYQLQYATNKDFKDAKLITISGNTNTLRSIRNLTNKQNYYIRIRTYVTVNKTKYYSAWSDSYKINVRTASTAKVIPQTQKVYEWPFGYGDKEYQVAYDDQLDIYYTVTNTYPGYRVHSATLYMAKADGVYKKVGTTDHAFIENWHHLYVENLKQNTAYFFKVVVLFVPKDCDTEKEFEKLTVDQKIYDETCSPEKFWTTFTPSDKVFTYSTKSSTLKWPAVKGATGYIVHEVVSKTLGYNIFGNPVFQHYRIEFVSSKNSAKSVIRSKVSGVSGKTVSFHITPYVKRGNVYYSWGNPVCSKLEYDKQLEWY